MARVVLTIRILPKEAGADLDGLRKRIEASLPRGTYVHRTSEEPIAFGLVALVADVVMPEEEGGSEVVENAIKSVDGVSSIQVLMVRRA